MFTPLNYHNKDINKVYNSLYLDQQEIEMLDLETWKNGLKYTFKRNNLCLTWLK